MTLKRCFPPLHPHSMYPFIAVFFFLGSLMMIFSLVSRRLRPPIKIERDDDVQYSKYIYPDISTIINRKSSRYTWRIFYMFLYEQLGVICSLIKANEVKWLQIPSYTMSFGLIFSCLSTCFIVYMSLA